VASKTKKQSSEDSVIPYAQVSSARRSGSRWLAAAVSAVAFGGGEALAQTDVEAEDPPEAASEAGAIVYPPSFFAAFKPANANDMVGRLPGFTFNKGDDVRGFGGAAGNVLIDGERPSSKAVPLDQVLQRIPTSEIERVELIRGGAPGIDMQGLPVVANVVRKTGASFTRAFQTLVKPYTNGFVGLNPRLEATYRVGRLSLDSLLAGRKDMHTDSGDGEITRRNAAGAVFQQGEFDSKVINKVIQANGSAAYRRLSDQFRLNLSAERNDLDREEAALPLDPGLGRFSERSRTKTRADKAEIGGDYQRDLAPWLSGQLIGLKTFKADRLNSIGQSRSPTQVSAEDSTSGETILRGVLSAVRSQSLRFEGGAEGAFNFLDARSSLTVAGAPVLLPSANVRVEERRAEGFITATAKPHAKLSVEAGLRWEVSTIRQTGGANQDKTLSFPKPRLIVSWAPDASSQLRLRVERQVGQLNFKDFAASAQIEANTVNAGNPDLEPERGWVTELALERRFWGGAAAVLTLAHADIQKVVDVIPIAGRFDAPGNIGDGTKDEVKFSLTLPLTRLGVSGGSLRFNGTWRRSKVTDPVTGLKRRISNQRPFEGDFLLSKAFPKLNASLNLEGSLGYVETIYRISEVRRTQETPLYKLYWDWSPRPDLIFRFQFENVVGKQRRRDRELFTGPRSAGVVNYVENRYAEQAPFLMVRVRKVF
jgi:outer membrane receptor protein involved in Fe transport